MKIEKYPMSPILRKTCKPVKEINPREQELLEDMVYTMHMNKGIGLAASQVGIDARLAVVDIGDGVIKLVNPKILRKSGSDTVEEGCLSIPDISIKVKRAKTILVEFLDVNGNTTTLEAHGLLARAIQHEIDHLNGRMIIDYANPIKRFFLKYKLARIN